MKFLILIKSLLFKFLELINWLVGIFSGETSKFCKIMKIHFSFSLQCIMTAITMNIVQLFFYIELHLNLFLYLNYLMSQELFIKK